jgi:phenylacetate-CoA ligase
MTRRQPTGDRSMDRLYPHILGLLGPMVIEPITGTRHISVSHWLRDFANWPEERRRAWQRARVEEVVAHAAQSVPFYRQMLGSRPDIRAMELGDLPVVDKARIRADEDAFWSADAGRIPHLMKKTGGTTGDPWHYPIDKRTWTHTYAARLHCWEETGYRYGERFVLLGAPPSLVVGATGIKARLRYLLEREVVAVAGMDVDHATSLRRALAATRSRAALWYGYAGTAAAMADSVIAEEIQVVGPRAVVTSSETLQPLWRRSIEAAFSCPVYDQYGCYDGGVVAQTCLRGRFHVAENLSLMEVLDGDRPCPPGVEGDVAVTNLHAQVLPFLRYKVGDRAVLGEGTCPCGRPGLTLERLGGRVWDRLRLGNGTELSPLAFQPLFQELPSVSGWQVVQQGERQLVVRLQVRPTFQPHEQQRIERYVRDRCGEGIEVTSTTSEHLDTTISGKNRVVVRGLES